MSSDTPSDVRKERERDLLDTHQGVFSYEDRDKIMSQAFAREEGGEDWTAIVRDFHKGEPRYWGFKTVPRGHKSTKKPLTEEQQRRKDVFIFFWTALQSLVIIKGFIMYFGLNYAIEGDDGFSGALSGAGHRTSFFAWGLAITLAISFGGLILFAIRKSRGREWK